VGQGTIGEATKINAGQRRASGLVALAPAATARGGNDEEIL
jgi:hypothetical protein